MLANTAVSSPSSTIRTRPSTKFSDSLRNRSTWVSPSRTSMAGVQPAVFRSPVMALTWARAPEVSRSSNTIRRRPEMESMMPASSALLPRKLSAKPFIMAGPKLRFTLGVTPMASPIGLRSTWPMSLDWANAVELSSMVENNKVRNALFISVSPLIVIGRLVVWSFGRLVVWSFGRLVVWSFGRLVVWSFGRLVVSKRRKDETTKPRKSLSRAVGSFEIRPNVSGVGQLGQPEVGHDETLLYFPAGQRHGALSGAIDGVERELQLGQVACRRGDDGRRPCRRLQTTVTTTAATRAAAMPSSHGPRCWASAVRRARALTLCGSSAAPRPVSSRLSAQSAARPGSCGVTRLFSNAIARSRSRSNESGDLCIGFLLEAAPQLTARPECVDLDLVFGKFERGCHRGNVEFLNVAKNQQRTRRLRHVRQGRAQLAGPLGAGEFIARPGVVGRSQRLVLACHQLQQAASSRSTTENIQAGMAGTGYQPGQFLARAQSFDVAPELDQRLLGHVLGFVVTPQHQAGQLVKPAAVLVNELFESTLHTHIYAGSVQRLQRRGKFSGTTA